MSYTVQLNDNCVRVFLLQDCLALRGFLEGIDGSFGFDTEEAVKQFQSSEGLDIDGIVGSGTWGKLIEGRFPVPTTLPLDRSQVEFIFNNTIEPDQLSMLNGAMELFHITTPARIRHFLAQIAHESAGLRYLEEIADGSDYEGREDLGNTEEGDGCRFKGIGPIQTTGRYGYQQLADYLGDQRIMEGCAYVRDNISPFVPSGFWWYDNDMNDLVDSGASCREVSARVNGVDPANGLEEREDYYAAACEVIFD